ncbi:MAG: type II toxin-antitoxin system HipA family toxin YjjJ [Paucibacter sp.]|nr:type II toxin-antitoxin system HipA family toxin YjjJ [Roseateles sp.]
MSFDPNTLLNLLRKQHLLSAQQLREALGVSAPTLMRAARAARGQVLNFGRARRSAYALRRPLRGSMAPLPLFAVDRTGRAEHVAQLHLAHPQGTLVELLVDPAGFSWPMELSGQPESRMRDGWFEGLPYFLQDMRPQGFLGRQFARQHAPLLQASENPTEWSDDDALYALSLLGSDHSGNFIIGDAAFHLWQSAVHAETPIAEGGEAKAYPALAQQAMGLGLGLGLGLGHQGSLAAGELPKFSALRLQASLPTRVLVKFSGSDDSPGTRRWADLLACEHLALESVQALPGVRAARSRLLRAGKRSFLEVERFDRQGLFGRSGLCSWAAINADGFGVAGSWIDGAAALARVGLIDAEAKRAIERLTFFGQLIANTDMHDGNLSFEPGGPGLCPAPIYDMLPMAYRPQVGVELPEVRFAPCMPLPGQREAWSEAAEAALQFWQRAAADSHVSAGFREICAHNAEAMEQARRRV